MAAVTVPQAQSPAPSAQMAFADERIFIVPSDKPADKLWFSQCEDGPAFIHVGINLSDAQLQAIWEKRKRFKLVSLEQLQTVRDCKVPQIELS